MNTDWLPTLLLVGAWIIFGLGCQGLLVCVPGCVRTRVSMGAFAETDVCVFSTLVDDR